MKKSTFFLALLLLCSAVSAATVKNVAVVETEVDEESGASELISGAEVRLVTAELRREAVKNLPQRRYNVMTTETVMAQGTAVLLECAEENCVISLGSKIGADFIVRGHISRIDAKLTLAVDVYDTEDGNLVASSEAVRAEKVADLLESAATACAEMYKSFVEAHSQPQESGTKKPGNISVGGGALFTTDFGGGAAWKNGGQIGTPQHCGGAYVALDFKYAAISIAYSQGGGKWKGPSDIEPDSLPYMRRSSLNVGLSSKYPKFGLGERIKAYPVLDVEYEFPVSGELEYEDKVKYLFDGNNKDKYTASALSAIWVRIGGGMDFNITKGAYLRAELLYGARTANTFEKDGMDIDGAEKTRLGHGLAVRAGAGVRL
jgi:hypothetical protein